jgi:hypothetical protein
MKRRAFITLLGGAALASPSRYRCWARQRGDRARRQRDLCSRRTRVLCFKAEPVALHAATAKQTGPDGAVPLPHERQSRQRETGLAQSEKRKLSSPQLVGLQPQVGARGGRPLPSHSSRPELRGGEGRPVQIASESKPRLVLLDEGEVVEEAAAEVLWADARHPYGCAASQADLDAHRQ